ncbi:DUF488 domain-containing protein [Kordiimonas sp. SCSIO 12610]|uniref:DUF488 domain-containing protein n=1 Tax=Kordiimonas sp. SCSIO 12610 TaxID=2829597 RepID=UPI00210909D2|nr:DUF488 family protein [Kordiimonas sp. SCSIO 12610]UTW54609.1 DUF488 family protein [Kordiimonas sp. SCSIO 12610]
MPIQIHKHARLHRDLFDGTRILITRYWLRGISRASVDEWRPELAPSKALLGRALDFWKGDPSEEESIAFSAIWQQAYEAEMLTQAEMITDLAHRHIEGETLTLLCSCHSQTHCHRQYLTDMILHTAETILEYAE